MREIAFAFVIFACSTFLCDCQFLSGTIHWMKESTSAIRFTYRLTWEKGYGPCGTACSTTHIGSSMKVSPGSNLSILQWRYTGGNTTSVLSDVSYYVTSVSVLSALGWEQGENSFEFRGYQTNQTYTVFLDSIPWISAVSGGNTATGYMETTVDLRLRSDTGKCNNSPYVSPQPFIGAAFGCKNHIRLPAEDPDGDIVRCRWAMPSECGGGCTNIPTNAVRLSKASCLLTINAFNETGILENTIYRLAIVIEDFPHGAIDVGSEAFTRNRAMSRVPLQLTLRTSAASMTCNSQSFTFVRSTPPNKFRYFTTPANLQRSTLYRMFYLQTDYTNSTEFMASTPRFVKYSIKPDYYKRNNVIQLTTTWKPKNYQTGDQQICLWGLQDDGVTTDSRCITEIISDIKNCHLGTCHNNGTCVNLFNVTYDICHCPKGFKPPFCLNETICNDEPCANNGTCSLKRTATVKYSCTCAPGYQGTDCEQERDHCVQTPCKNNATCLDLQDRYLCLCSNNFSGTNCETALNENTKDSAAHQDIAPWIPTTATVGGLVTFAGLAAIIYKFKPANSISSDPNKTPVKPTKSSVINVKPANSHLEKPKGLEF